MSRQKVCCPCTNSHLGSFACILIPLLEATIARKEAQFFLLHHLEKKEGKDNTFHSQGSTMEPNPPCSAAHGEPQANFLSSFLPFARIPYDGAAWKEKNLPPQKHIIHWFPRLSGTNLEKRTPKEVGGISCREVRLHGPHRAWGLEAGKDGQHHEE